MRSLILRLVLLFSILVPTLMADRFGPVGHRVYAQRGECVSTLIGSDGGYVPELGVSWSSQTYWSACVDAVGNVSFHYTTVFVMIFDSGHMYMHMNIS